MNTRTFSSPHVIADETTAPRYVIYLLSCARSVRLGPLAEHVMRSVDGSPAAPSEAAGLLDESLSAPWLDEHLAAYAQKYAGLVTGFTWSAPSGSEEHPAGTPQLASRFQRRVEIENLIANAHALRVVFTWDADHPWLHGSIKRTLRPTAVRRDLTRPPEDFLSDELRATGVGPVIVSINSTLPGDQAFNVLLHELAHLLLAHVGLDPLGGTPDAVAPVNGGAMLQPLRELEAESAAIIAGSRRCAMRHEGFSYVRHYFDLVRRNSLMPFVAFVRIFVVAEILTAWCRTRPDREAVRLPQRATPPTRPHGRSRERVKVESA